ncbi:hypothetical protein SODALDRAFT_328926 [Sodiomyces alkalinus F11]|uniref:Uncharacterized protein n=1 Tax=Sodiomyces alkalinus (strain CBS 110278 / VKM F-3762 / F11) TaxID=1314773 RepID=A0A3N2PM08_SODAK|nr:hypothetical protein SODALDRAFT_328926 [Sodiomyces alkalinus F11]ROT35562.1 hypothetical protein SODALDRAFT_328926 [Sodiomyces alkalinus F11]
MTRLRKDEAAAALTTENLRDFSADCSVHLQTRCNNLSPPYPTQPVWPWTRTFSSANQAAPGARAPHPILGT